MSNGWRQAGEYFGYPDCCIESFCRMEQLNEPSFENGTRPLNGTGFVPCKDCAESKTAERLTFEINEKRVCVVPFPSPAVNVSYEHFKRHMVAALSSPCECGGREKCDEGDRCRNLAG